MIWFEPHRVPDGCWPFLNTIRNALQEFERSIADEIDLTEGERDITITGCMRAYREAVVCRVLDLTQSVIAAWNAGLPVGAIVASRALLETIAIYHSFLRRADAAASAKDWEMTGKLVDAYAFFTSSNGIKKQRTAEDPPSIGIAVREFIKATESGKESFWNQICDTAHPNGQRMLTYAGTLRDGKFVAKIRSESEPSMFVALYNALYSCCWFSASGLEFDILLERIRTGGELAPDHPLIVERGMLDKFTAEVLQSLGPLNPGPHEKMEAE